VNQSADLLADYRVQMNQLQWPTIEDILESQSTHLQDHCDFNLGSTDLFQINEKIVIPDEDYALRMRLTVIAHAGLGGGHFGQQLTLRILQEKFVRSHMKTDVQKLVGCCLHCLPTLGGTRIPRPLGSALHGNCVNEVIHFDFLYIQQGPLPWLFVIRDDLSGFTWLKPFDVPESKVVVDTLMEWRINFGTPKCVVSDNGSYFVGKVLKEFAEQFQVRQHFTTAYIHYPNGSIEVINNLILQALRAMLSELRLDKQNWMELIPIVNYYLNHKPQTRLKMRTPVEVMTGHSPDSV
jgi:hypothetical protein